MSRVISCPHRAFINSLSVYCLNGNFPVDCENCDCKDKKYVEEYSSSAATLLQQ